MTQVTINPAFPPSAQAVPVRGSTLVSVAPLGFPNIGTTGPMDLSLTDDSGNALASVKTAVGTVFPLNLSITNGLNAVIRSSSAVVFSFS